MSWSGGELVVIVSWSGGELVVDGGEWWHGEWYGFVELASGGLVAWMTAICDFSWTYQKLPHVEG